MSFVENLYLIKQLQNLQEENNQLRYLLEVNSEKTEKTAMHRIKIEDVIKEISQINGHDRNLVSNAQKAIKGRAHPTVLAGMLSKLEQHLSTIRSGSQQQAPRPSSGAYRSIRSVSQQLGEDADCTEKLKALRDRANARHKEIMSSYKERQKPYEEHHAALSNLVNRLITTKKTKGSEDDKEAFGDLKDFYRRTLHTTKSGRYGKGNSPKDRVTSTRREQLDNLRAEEK
jgi:hypothetical protein